ncbi:MAG TPA: aminotransferase class III-fold pyridoxal phosphate-dependent enzyme [Haliangiales bacterium]|nr:aminotransferase class III-fold pyridoxal phosphate-dependent enzyme [Haliangiales bacterium]
MDRSIRYPEGNVLLRNLARDMPIISHGEGIYLFDAAGKRYIDASAGALVAGLGHGNRRVADAIHAQLARVGYVNGTQFTSEATETLARRLAALAEAELPAAGLTRAAFLCSGSEAVEAAVKFVRQLWMERGQPQRTKFVARVPSYHGNTLYALSLSGRPHYKKLYGPMLSEVVVAAAPYPYRSGLADYARDGAAHYARLLEEAIARAGPETIAGFIAEPVIGSSAGAAVPPPGYFERAREICARHGILMIADEILCGAGRCGAFFAARPTGFTPDVAVLGKGLGGGYAPLSAVLVRQDHVEEMRRGSGHFQHAQTYLQAPFITAAGVAVLDEYDRLDLVAHARRVGELFQARLRERLAPLPRVGSVQGMGLLAGVELVEDKATQAPFPRGRRVIERACAHLFDRGIIVWPNVGHANGTDGDLFMLGPPLVIDAAQVDELVDAVAAALKELTP